jgi:Arc/MetJ-type ribon-helix-helix transcriptional regulator
MTNKKNIETKENRITFRPTKKVEYQISRMMKTGRWFSKSDLIRQAIWIGLNELEGKE